MTKKIVLCSPESISHRIGILLVVERLPVCSGGVLHVNVNVAPSELFERPFVFLLISSWAVVLLSRYVELHSQVYAAL